MDVDRAKGVNTPWSPRMRSIELSDKIWSIDITFVLPGILLITVPLPFDEELQIGPFTCDYPVLVQLRNVLRHQAGLVGVVAKHVDQE